MKDRSRRLPLKIRRSADEVSRLAALRRVTYPSQLPIAAKRSEIVEAIRRHKVVIIVGETGSGKTTQIPKMCLEAGRGRRGMIGCTQPRRVAAIATAMRISEEMGEGLGNTVGYKVRFDDKTGSRPLIKIMTDGILLMETQADPSLQAYDTIIVDEAHERSLNIDFILGIIRTLLTKRNNLKLVITSATLDSEKFSRAFSGAPVIDVSGRTYPVDVIYLPTDKDSDENADLSDPEAAALAVEKLWENHQSGDILIFMATERDIRETCEILKGQVERGTVLLPLFARMPWSEQRRIFDVGPAQRIVVATNIAETSLTIPGIRYVVDPGTARLSQYNPRLRTTSLPVRGISRSSSEQRKGRCGRVSKGVCVRLYSEEEYNNRPLFTPPEIMRSNLAGVVLRMLALRLGDIFTFPFIDPPTARSFQDALDTLRELGAIHSEGDKRNTPELTERGRFMARIPLDPRLSRMLLEARKEGCLVEMAVLAAALSLPDPRERPADREAEADRMQSCFQDPSSDFMTLLNIWKGFREIKSRNQARKYCRDHFLSYKRMREWQDVYEQIEEILREENFRKGAVVVASDYQARYAAIHKSVLSGYLSNIAFKKGKNLYQATRGREIMLFPGSGLFNRGGHWIVTADIVETSRVFARSCANIEVAWLEELGGELCKSLYSEPHWEKNRGEVVAAEQVSLFGLIIVPRRLVSYGAIAPEEASTIFIREALVAGEVKHPLPFLLYNRRLMESIAALEDKIRRSELLVSDEAVISFYEQRLKGIYNIKTLQKLIKDQGGDSFLRLSENDLLADRPDPEELSLYPDTLTQGEDNFPLVYSFTPGTSQDGVTVKIPLPLLSHFSPVRAEWLVPGLLKEKIYHLLRGLPKDYRKKLLPLSGACDIICREMKDNEGHFLAELAGCIYRHYGIEIPVAAWPSSTLPDYLRMRFAVVDQLNRDVAASRDLSELQKHIPAGAKSQAFEEYRKKWERSGISRWDFGELPETLELKDGNGPCGLAYPALVPHENGIHLRLFGNKDEAIRSHVEGIISLFSLHFHDELKYLQKNLSLNDQEKLYTKHLGGPKVVEMALYRRVLRNLFALNVRTGENFLNHAAKVESLIQPAGQEVCRTILPVLAAYHQTWESLRSFDSGHRTSRPARQFLAALQQAFVRIVSAEFIEVYPAERIIHLPRYLRGLTIGAQRGMLHLEKALGKIREMQLLIEELDEMKGNLPAFTSDEKRLTIEEYFWMLEEYRVSLFAQELKTAFPVSRKKLAKKFQEIKMMV